MIFQFQVFPALIEFKPFLANIALGKSATQSSTVTADYASKAVDGNTATSLQSSSCTHTDLERGWWRVDFGNTSRVHSVKITNRGKGIKINIKLHTIKKRQISTK